MTRKRILIVEDETLIAADLAGRLEKLGYEVSGIATGGAEALSTAAENPPDAVLMDITLSDEMNGIDAAAELHGRRGIPVIYLTAHADIPTLTRARETEPHGILLKPIRDIDLMSALETAIQRHSLEVRLRASEE
nr:response regulator [Spirochaetota bacterium]